MVPFEPLSKSTEIAWGLDLRDMNEARLRILSNPGQVMVFQDLTTGAPFGAEFLLRGSEAFAFLRLRKYKMERIVSAIVTMRMVGIRIVARRVLVELEPSPAAAVAVAVEGAVVTSVMGDPFGIAGIVLAL